jgi:hypothetical protein
MKKLHYLLFVALISLSLVYVGCEEEKTTTTPEDNIANDIEAVWFSAQSQVGIELKSDGAINLLDVTPGTGALAVSPLSQAKTVEIKLTKAKDGVIEGSVLHTPSLKTGKDTSGTVTGTYSLSSGILTLKLVAPVLLDPKLYPTGFERSYIKSSVGATPTGALTGIVGKVKGIDFKTAGGFGRLAVATYSSKDSILTVLGGTLARDTLFASVKIKKTITDSSTFNLGFSTTDVGGYTSAGTSTKSGYVTSALIKATGTLTIKTPFSSTSTFVGGRFKFTAKKAATPTDSVVVDVSSFQVGVLPK